MAEPETEGRLKIVCPSCRQKLDVTDLEPFSGIDCPSCKGKVIVPKPFGTMYLEECLGRGGMAAVYRALDMTLDREVAVKILHDDLARQADRMKLFLSEARSAAAVNHPAIVPIYSCGESEGQPYIVMQYMGGLSIAGRLSTQTDGLGVDFCLKMARAAAEGLAAAHRHAITHGDVKPSNILIDTEGHIKVSDFGLVRVLREEGVPSPDGVAKAYGSLCYCSPELLRSGIVDYRGDIYGLGATLYHVLTGRRPFGEQTPGEVARIRNLNPVPVPPATLRAEIPERLSALVMDWMHPDLGCRPQSYDAVLDSLENVNKSGKKSVSVKKPVSMSLSPRSRAARADAASGGRSVRRSKSPAERLVDTCLVVCSLAVLLLFVLAVRQRPVWYVEHVEPRLHALVATLPSGVRLWERRGQAQQQPATPDATHASRPLPAVPVELSPADPEMHADPAGPRAAIGPGASHRPHVELASGSADDDALGPVMPAPVDGAGRPRPADLNFHAIKEPLEEYLRGLPPARRELERERLGHLSQSRDYLIRLMKYLPYEADPPVVKLRDGRVIEGTIPYCNEHEVSVRLSPPQEGLKTLAWSELAIDQYVAFFGFYMQKRLSQGEGATTHNNGKHQQEAGEDSIRLALLCDWYGYPELARKYADLAREYAPSRSRELSRLLPSSANIVSP